MSEPGSATLAPGAVIGILGGGQLARMMALAAFRLGYRVALYDPDRTPPAGDLCPRHFCAAYNDLTALGAFADHCSVVTYEFENIPVATARHLARLVPVRPGPLALERSQDRLAEKSFLHSAGARTAPFFAVETAGELDDALAETGGQGIVKTRRLGYDGKGQVRIRGVEGLEDAQELIAAQPCILEGFVEFDREISVIAARSATGEFRAYDPAENVHEDGILQTSTLPARIDRQVAEQAKSIARGILEALDYCGVMGVEFFVSGRELHVNEIAPRVHNSGHWTEAACLVSQFEQHIRAVCGLPLGDPARHSDCVMENLIGSDVERAAGFLARGDAMVHLYGKRQVREGRKMGHVTTLHPRMNER